MWGTASEKFHAFRQMFLIEHTAALMLPLHMATDKKFAAGELKSTGKFEF